MHKLFASLFLLTLLSLPPSRVIAHSGGAIPTDLWAHWNWDWFLLLGLALPVALFLRGAMTYPLQHGRTASFVTAIGALFIALVSPLDAVSESLFSAHMVQHLLLILVAAPLLVWSRPMAPILRGIPRPGRRALGVFAHHPSMQRVWAKLTGATTVLILHIVALWVWHLPTLYSATLVDPTVHKLEHASFFVSAALYWWVIYSSDRFGGRLLSLFSVMMASGLLGVLMTFASAAWYVDHTPYVEAWELTPLEDQQLAGLFMWIPAGILYATIAAWLLGAWLHAVERRVVQRERHLVKEMGDV